MTTVAKIESRPTEPEGDQCVALWNIDWKGYSAFLKMRGERRLPRMIYLDGSLFLTSPSMRHDNLIERLGRFVTEVVTGLGIPSILAASTTLRRTSQRGGVEGDQTYYLANFARIRGKKKVSLRVDPPPDLAIEVVVSHDADEAIEVYRRLKVLEVWICDDSRLTIIRLESSGKYTPAERSVAFPVLTASEIHSWLIRDQGESDAAWIKALRRWVAEVLAPRHRELEKQEKTETKQQTE
jgi:Uma2 family endonuclease